MRVTITVRRERREAPFKSASFSFLIMCLYYSPSMMITACSVRRKKVNDGAIAKETTWKRRHRSVESRGNDANLISLHIHLIQ